MKLPLTPARAVQNLKPSYIREILSAANRDDVISLAGGLPDAQSFPLDLMAKQMAQLGEHPSLFQYGSTAGFAPLRRYLKDVYNLSPEQDLLICTGSQQGLDLIARSFINPGDNIVLEAPSYLGALQVFDLVEANIHSVDQTKNGPDLIQLETCFKNHNIKFFYAVPDFHNPTGICWTAHTRNEVARLCNLYQVTLIEDAPYRKLRFTGQDLPLVSDKCHALVLTSFSKIATPGIRIGAVYGSTENISTLIKVKQASDLHSSVPMQWVLLQLLKDKKFSLHLQNLRALYKQRYQALCNAITQYMPDARFKPVDGGMFIWLELPSVQPKKINDFAAAALNKGVAIVPCRVFYSDEREDDVAAVRLNFSNATEQDLTTAIKRLTTLLMLAEFTLN